MAVKAMIRAWAKLPRPALFSPVLSSYLPRVYHEVTSLGILGFP